MGVWRSSRALHALFGVYVGAVFGFAWIHASSLARAWYTAELSRWLYTVYLLAGAIVLSMLFIVSLVFWMFPPGSSGRRVRTVGPVSVNPTRGRPSDEPVLFSAHTHDDDAIEGEIDDLLERISELDPVEGSDGMVIVKKRRTVVAKRPVVAAKRPSTRAAGPIRGSRSNSATMSQVRVSASEAVKTLRGPMVAAATFVGLAAAMLPGVDGMLVTYYQLNTALILGLAYGWMGLAAYVALSIRASLRMA